MVISISKTIFFADITKTNLIEYINSARKSLGLSPLSENKTLERSAFLKAQDILEKDYFAHYSPEGKSPWYWFRISGYDYAVAGENLAIGFLDSKEVFDAWMNSQTHRENILNPNYQEIGISVLKGEFNGDEVYVVVQHFGKPKTIYQSQQPIPQKPISLPEEPQTSTTPTTTLGGTETKSEEKSETSTEIASAETSTETIKEPSPLPSPTQEISTPPKKFSFSLFRFLSLNYTQILNKIIYFILLFLIFSLILTIFFDIFVYKKFVIDYKELIPRFFFFLFILIIFLYLDQSKIIKIFPHKFSIYGL